jgi:protein-tyrosine kinase
MDRIKQALDRAKAEQGSLSVGKPAPVQSLPGKVAEEDIKYSQTKICKLDAQVLRENRVIFGDADRKGLSAYKMLRTQVLQRMTANGWNALAVTSPLAGDGKSLTAINLAISLARELHHTVLLVDMDLRNPSIHKYFGFAPEKGINDCLLHGTPMGEALVNPGIDRLVVLPGRESVENSSEILASPAVGRLVQELKTRYPSRMVLFDLPPILAADDALSFAPFVDAFLLVVRDGQTTHGALEQSLEIMKETTLLGSVLNAAEEGTSTYYY